MDTAPNAVADSMSSQPGEMAMNNGMKRNFVGAAVAMTLSFCAAGPAVALNPGDTVDNFRLLDHTGASRELYYLSDMKAVVLMAQGNGCEVVRKSLPELQSLRDKYR